MVIIISVGDPHVQHRVLHLQSFGDGDDQDGDDHDGADHDGDHHLSWPDGHPNIQHRVLHLKKYTFEKYIFGKYTLGKYNRGIYTFGKYIFKITFGWPPRIIAPSTPPQDGDNVQL